MRKINEKCKMCNKPMRKAGKVIQSGKKAQRYQCVNESCPNFGVYVTRKIVEEKIEPMSPEDMKKILEANGKWDQ